MLKDNKSLFNLSHASSLTLRKLSSANGTGYLDLPLKRYYGGAEMIQISAALTIHLKILRCVYGCDQSAFGRCHRSKPLESIDDTVVIFDETTVVMEMPDGQILTYHSHHDIPLTSIEDMVSLNRAGTESVGMLIDTRTNASNLLSLEHLAMIIPQPSLSHLTESPPSSDVERPDWVSGVLCTAASPC